MTHYQWDSRHRLVALTAPGLVASFTYDAIGRRTSKTVNGQTTTYLYDGQQAVGEIRPGAVGEAGHDNITVNLTGLQLDEAIARYTYTQGSTNGSGTSVRATTLLTDLLGSVIAQTDAAQRVQTRHRYSPYGEVTTEGDDDDNPVQYTGRENDGTGLYFYRARYYDAVAKRFISSDPIGLAGGLNTYSYVGGNPLSMVDPYGLFGMADMPMIPQPVLDFTTGVADAASLGLGPLARKALDINGGVNRCSKAYSAGEWASLGLGAGRMAYAGLAKAGAMAAADGAGAMAFRNGLKRVMRGPLAGSDFRIKNYADLMKKYGSDEAIQTAAGRTNDIANAVGADLTIGGAAYAASCGCQ